MYLSRATISNIKGLRHVEFSFDEEHEAGWHVLLGDNGTGKSALIRSIALALVGPDEAAALREDWSRWITWGQTDARISLQVHFPGQWDRPEGTGHDLTARQLTASIELRLAESNGHTPGPRPIWGGRRATLKATNRSTLLPYLWGNGYGWFSSSFGPFRRFSGGSSDYERLFYANPRVARHLSAFSEEVALSESLTWLKTRRRDEDDGRCSTKLIPWVQRLVNDTELLPHQVTLDEITRDDLLFSDGHGVTVDVLALSDGYRSILSLTFELIRQMVVTYGEDHVFAEKEGDVFVDPPGVALIDEVDAHLHPTWQAVVGTWFRRRFPNMQFIVATHSPLVCRAIGDHGKVFRLRAPGSQSESDNALQPIEDIERDKLRFGSLHRALESQGFALRLSRSDEGRQKVRELARLNREARKRELDPAESKLRGRLREIFSDNPDTQQ
ncbi:MAG: AAA family ATPase [Myxococcota bacterium]